MARWKKLLDAMLADSDPRDYSYEDAATVLHHLGFEMAPHGGGSHRKWRFRRSDGLVVVVGLVDRGSGTLKPVYIGDMLTQLKDSGLLPH